MQSNTDTKVKSAAAGNQEDFLVDCVITAGELDESGYRFKNNDLNVFETVKHNVPYSEFVRWISSPERFRRERELYAKAKERFGETSWMKYEVCCFCTSPSED